MKKFTIEATKENILKSIQKNTYNRNMDIKDFVEALDMIEGNMFISLDAKWGAGKTFYVRQIEQTLKYLISKKNGRNIEKLKPYFSGNDLDKIELNHTYFPVYYNAWLYDNHDDPLMSLLLNILKEYEGVCDTKLNSSTIFDILTTLIDSLSIFHFKTNDIKKIFASQDILSSVKTAEEIKKKVKEIFDVIIVENVEKLIIFVDELDRCKPSFALELLERIKHYFDDDRIIFIFSINKSQLVYTISKYYGEGFDATLYLNKFFDLNIYLPVIKREEKIYAYSKGQVLLEQIANELMEYYKLSFRDGLIYSQYISEISNTFVNDYEEQGCCLSVFVPIILILDITNQGEKDLFLNGNSSILEELCLKIPAISKMISRFCDQNDSSKFDTGYKKIKEVYDFTFAKQGNVNKICLEISSDIKAICIKICNGFLK